MSHQDPSNEKNKVFLWKKPKILIFCWKILPRINQSFHSPPFGWLIQEGLLSVTSESMCTNYWWTACSSLPRKKCVKWTDRPAMTIAVDMGRKATKTKQTFQWLSIYVIASLELDMIHSKTVNEKLKHMFKVFNDCCCPRWIVMHDLRSGHQNG